MGVAPKIIHFNKIFPQKPSSYWGQPYDYGNLQVKFPFITSICEKSNLNRSMTTPNSTSQHSSAFRQLQPPQPEIPQLRGAGNALRVPRHNGVKTKQPEDPRTKFWILQYLIIWICLIYIYIHLYCNMYSQLNKHILPTSLGISKNMRIYVYICIYTYQCHCLA